MLALTQEIITQKYKRGLDHSDDTKYALVLGVAGYVNLIIKTTDFFEISF